MPRTHTSLDGAWQLVPDFDQQLDLVRLDSIDTPRSVTVPGPWQSQLADMRDEGGTVWYRRSFTPPASDLADPVYIIHFGAVDYYATVWLNGQLLGEHEGGYLPFEFECVGLHTDGPNDLVVRVVDPADNRAAFEPYRFDEIPHGKQSWYGPVGGIWQSVYVEARSRTHLERIKVTPVVAEERADVALFLNRPLAGEGELRCVLTAPNGATSSYTAVVRAGEARCELTLPVPQPQLWDIGQPHLYQLQVELIVAGQAVDQQETTFGMRTVGTAGGYITLNGRPIYLRGALDQDYYPHGVYTVFEDERLDDQFSKAKELGLNCIRTHIKITDPRYYAAADRAGVLIWTELPNWRTLTPAAKERAKATFTAMVERDWNHPSIIIWTIINEDWGTQLAANPDHRAWLGEMYGYAKALDPTRLVVDNSACFGNFHVASDLDDFHVYYSIPDHYHKWKRWTEAFANRPFWSYAFDYDYLRPQQDLVRDLWNFDPKPPTAEVRRSGHEPLLVSEFGNWGLPDIDGLYAGYGGAEPWWFETGMEWGMGVVYPHGIEQRFHRFHLDKVFGTLSNLAQASQRMQFLAMKYEIEQMRRHAPIGGYVITEFTDVNWECNGLLDIHRNPKAYHEVFHQVNGDDVIVPLWERTAYWEEERCLVSVVLSHFSTLDLAGSRLEWSVADWPEAEGSIAGLTPQRAGTTHLGAVEFAVPPLEASARVRLELRLFDKNDRLVAENHQELYVFPRRLATVASRNGAPRIYTPDPKLRQALGVLGYATTNRADSADLIVARTMNDDLRRRVQQGARVLWLAEARESLRTNLDGISIQRRYGSRWQGDWASNFNWLRQDAMFGAIPSGGTLDFAFADLIPDHVISGLKPYDFAEDVHAGLAVGWLHFPVGLIVERRIDTGRLLVSTFTLRDHLPAHPVAAIMLHDLIGYAAR